jgi:subtilisin family serine protease
VSARPDWGIAILGIALAAALGAWPGGGRAQPAPPPLPRDLDLADPHRPDELLVVLPPVASPEWERQAERERGEIYRRLGVRELLRMERIRVAILQLRPPGGDAALEAVAAELRQHRDLFARVDPNHLVFLAQGSQDPHVAEQWGLQKIEAPAAWAITLGSASVKVAVIDSGIDTTHPDLDGQLWENAAEVSGVPGSDDDGNGYVDDLHGWSWAELGSGGATDKGSPDVEDERDHGTQVSGVIGAEHQNGACIRGVAGEVRLIPLKVVGMTGEADVGRVVAALEYAVGVEADIVNLSASTSHDPELLLALQDASKLLVVAAAGQEGRDLDVNVSYPCSFLLPNVVCVTATDQNDDLIPDGNVGNATVHLGAPGEEIVSTIRQSGCGSHSGSSLAAPYVTGVAVLVKARCPDASVADIRARLLDGDPVTSLAGKTVSGTRVNARRALGEECPGSGFEGWLQRLRDWIRRLCDWLRSYWPWKRAGASVTPK